MVRNSKYIRWTHTVAVLQCRWWQHHCFCARQIGIAYQYIQLSTSETTDFLRRAFEICWAADVDLNDMDILSLRCKFVQRACRLLTPDKCYDRGVGTSGYLPDEFETYAAGGSDDCP
jgi:hypothetical protein